MLQEFLMRFSFATVKSVDDFDIRIKMGLKFLGVVVAEQHTHKRPVLM
jgi:hypothetical protein